MALLRAVSTTFGLDMQICCWDGSVVFEFPTWKLRGKNKTCELKVSKDRGRMRTRENSARMLDGTQKKQKCATCTKREKIAEGTFI